jgi:capsular exopolysaccharide synthesis family protein
MTPLEPNNKSSSPTKPAPMWETQRRPSLATSPGPAPEPDAKLPPGLSATPTLAALLHALGRRWLLAVGLGVAASALGVAAVLVLFPAKYTAQARFEVAARSASPIFFQGQGDEDFPHFKNKIASLLKSPLVLNAALYDKDVQDLETVRRHASPVEWLETALKTDYLLGPEVLRVSLGGDQPEDVAKLLNAIAFAFLKEIEQREKTRRLTLLEELKTNQRFEEDGLRQKQVMLRKLEEERGLEDLDTTRMKFQAALNELTGLKKARMDKRQDQINTQEEIHALQAKDKAFAQTPITADQFDEAFRGNVRVQIFLAEKAKLQKEIVDIQRVSPGSQALIAQKQEDLERLDKELKDVKEKLRPEVERELRDRLHDELKATIVNLRDRLKLLKTQEEELHSEVQRMDEGARKLNPSNRPKSADMVGLENQIAYTQSALQELGKKIATLAVEPAANTRVTLLQKAEVPGQTDNSRQAKMAGMAGFGLFGLVLLGVSFWEFRSRKISQVDEVVQGLGLNVVGTLPALPNRARSPLSRNASPGDLLWQSQLNEAVDAIRTRLLHESRAGEIKVLMVTSAVSGEGKTSLASQLAASLARAWKNTLLVDGDLRHPASHALFDLPQEPGLSELLRGEAAPADAIRPTPLSRLWMIPAGHWDSHAIQALAQPSVKSLFTQLKEQYDFIIVDSCPVLPVTDSLLLGQHVDAVLFSILRDVSRTPAVHAAQQRLNQLGIRLLGAVVVGAREDSTGAGYIRSARAG